MRIYRITAKAITLLYGEKSSLMPMEQGLRAALAMKC
nr:MAG TPA: hypothetical protein [Bacteriophage sp.]